MKETLKHPTVSAILGTVIGTIIVTPIVAYINKINIIDALILIINWIKSIIALIISFQVPFWIILVALFVFLFIKRIANKLNSQGSIYDKQSIEKHYRQDRIDNILWIFEWDRSYDGKLNLKNCSPHPICPDCMNDLVVSNTTAEGYHSNRTIRFVCENCGFSQKLETNIDDYRMKIERELIRRVRTGEWSNSLQEHSS